MAAGAAYLVPTLMVKRQVDQKNSYWWIFHSRICRLRQLKEEALYLNNIGLDGSSNFNTSAVVKRCFSFLKAFTASAVSVMIFDLPFNKLLSNATTELKKWIKLWYKLPNPKNHCSSFIMVSCSHSEMTDIFLQWHWRWWQGQHYVAECEQGGVWGGSLRTVVYCMFSVRALWQQVVQ